MLDMNFEIVTSGREFEEVLYRRITAAGYECELTPETGDQGVDLIVRSSGVSIAIQCKLYTAPVGNDAVQEVFAGMAFHGCGHAAVVTNASFTDAAVRLAGPTGVALLHYTKLGEYLDTLLNADGNRDSTEKLPFEYEFSFDALGGDQSAEALAMSDGPLSRLRLAFRYFIGRGVPQSNEEGMRLLELALKASCPEAHLALTLPEVVPAPVIHRLFQSADLDPIEYQLNLATSGSAIAGAYIFTKAREGNREYEFPLACLYGHFGRTRESIEWAKRSYEHDGDGQTSLFLASLYQSLGNYEDCVTWAKRAYQHGTPGSAHFLAQLFDDKSTPVYCLEEADRWYGLSVESGDSRVAFVHAKRLFKRLNFEQSLEFLSKAADCNPREVEKFLKDEFLVVRALTPECLRRAESLKRSCMRSYGGRLSDQDIVKAIDDARQGDTTAVEDLCRTASSGFSNSIPTLISQDVADGAEWACLIMGWYYYRKGKDAQYAYRKIEYFVDAIKMGCDKPIAELAQLASYEELARNAIRDNSEVRLMLEQKGYDVSTLSEPLGTMV